MSGGARIVTIGDQGFVVELGDEIDPGVNARVRRLAHAVTEQLGHDVLEVVPTYRSLLVLHDPLRVPRGRLVERVQALVAELPDEAHAESAGRLVHMPACYGGPFGPDLEAVARHTNLDPGEVVALHSGATYRVYMLGFTPGFGYFGGLPAKLETPRLDTPRPRVPAGSVAIGGQQTGIYPVESPGGWRLIGRTPVRLFDAGSTTPFLLQAGDRVRFEPIAPEAFDAIARQVAAGEYVPHIEDEP